MILPSCRCRAHKHAKIWALSFFLTVNKLSIDPVLHLSIYGTPAGYGWPLEPFSDSDTPPLFPSSGVGWGCLSEAVKHACVPLQIHALAFRIALLLVQDSG